MSERRWKNDRANKKAENRMKLGDLKKAIAKALEAAKKEIVELGGLKTFRSGEWLFRLIIRSFNNYYERATADYFSEKYPGLSRDDIAQKLISTAAANAGLAGALTGAGVSLDELVALFTAGEGGIGLPANVTLALTSIAGELLLVTKIQLQLVAELAHLYDVPLDANDPEDILTILQFAAGGGSAEILGKIGVKVGKRVAAKTVRHYVKKEVLEAIKAFAQKLGVKLLQRTIVNAAVPGVSIVIGEEWNRRTTKAVGRLAIKHFKKKAVETKAATAHSAA